MAPRERRRGATVTMHFVKEYLYFAVINMQEMTLEDE
jgi:hypothetical protein